MTMPDKIRVVCHVNDESLDLLKIVDSDYRLYDPKDSEAMYLRADALPKCLTCHHCEDVEEPFLDFCHLFDLDLPRKFRGCIHHSEVA